MTDFNSAEHPRRNDGKFAIKAQGVPSLGIVSSMANSTFTDPNTGRDVHSVLQSAFDEYQQDPTADRVGTFDIYNDTDGGGECVFAASRLPPNTLLEIDDDTYGNMVGLRVFLSDEDTDRDAPSVNEPSPENAFVMSVDGHSVDEVAAAACENWTNAKVGEPVDVCGIDNCYVDIDDNDEEYVFVPTAVPGDCDDSGYDYDVYGEIDGDTYGTVQGIRVYRN